MLGVWGPDGHRGIGVEKYWRMPYQWNDEAKARNERERVFPSLMDPFEDRPDLIPHRARMFDVIDACPWIDFLLFTKRPQEARRLWVGGRRKNVWLIYSASDQHSYDLLVPELLRCVGLAPVLGISAEPLLGPIDFHFDDCLVEEDCYMTGERLSWIVFGGESHQRHRARPCELAWIRYGLRQCEQFGVARFVKQAGDDVWTGADDPAEGHGVKLILPTKKGGNLDELPEDLRIREFPEAA